MKSTMRKKAPLNLARFQEVVQGSQSEGAKKSYIGFSAQKMGRLVSSSDFELMAGPKANSSGLQHALGFLSDRDQRDMTSNAQLAILLRRVSKAIQKSLPFEQHPNSSFPIRDETYRSPDGTVNPHQDEHNERRMSELRNKWGDKGAEEYADAVQSGDLTDVARKYKDDKVQPGTRAASSADADDCDHPGGDLDSYVHPEAQARGYDPRTKTVNPDLAGLGPRDFTAKIYGEEIAHAIFGERNERNSKPHDVEALAQRRLDRRAKRPIDNSEPERTDDDRRSFDDTYGTGESSPDGPMRVTHSGNTKTVTWGLPPEAPKAGASDEPAPEAGADPKSGAGIWPGGASSSPPPPEESGEFRSKADEQEGGPPGGIVPSKKDPTPDKPISPESATRDPLAEARHSPDGTKVSDPAKFKAFITNARKYLRIKGFGTKVINKAASMEIARGLLAGKKGGGFGSKSMGMIHEQAQKEAANAGVRNGKRQDGDPLQGLSPKKMTKYYAMAIRSIFGAHKERVKASRSGSSVMSAPAEGGSASLPPPETAPDAAKIAEQALSNMDNTAVGAQAVSPADAGDSDETTGEHDVRDNGFDDIRDDMENGVWISTRGKRVDLNAYLDADGELLPGYKITYDGSGTPKVVKTDAIKSFRKAAQKRESGDELSVSSVISDPDYAPSLGRDRYSSSESDTIPHTPSPSSWLSLNRPPRVLDQTVTNGSDAIATSGKQKVTSGLFNDREDGGLLPRIAPLPHQLGDDGGDPSKTPKDSWLSVDPETGEWGGKLSRIQLGALSFPIRAGYHLASRFLHGLTGINTDNVLDGLSDAAKLAVHGGSLLHKYANEDPSAPSLSSSHNGTLLNGVTQTAPDAYGATYFLKPKLKFSELMKKAQANPSGPEAEALYKHVAGHDITREPYAAYMKEQNDATTTAYQDAFERLRAHHEREEGALDPADVARDTASLIDPDAGGADAGGADAGGADAGGADAGGADAGGADAGGSGLAKYTDMSRPEEIESLDSVFHGTLAGIYGDNPDGTTAEDYLKEYRNAEVDGTGSDVDSLITAMRKRGSTINATQAADILEHYSRKPDSPEEEEGVDGDSGALSLADYKNYDDIQRLDKEFHDELKDTYGTEPNGMTADDYLKWHNEWLADEPSSSDPSDEDDLSDIGYLIKEMQKRGCTITEEEAAGILAHYSRIPDSERVAEEALKTLDDAPVSTRLADAPIGESAFVKMRNSRWSEAVRELFPPRPSELPQLQMPDPAKNTEELDRAGAIATKFKGDHSRNTLREEQRPQLELMNSDGTVVTYKSAPKLLGVGTTSVVFRMEPLGEPEDGHEPFALKTWLQNGLFTGVDDRVYPPRRKKEKFNNEYDTLSLLSAAGACVPRPVFDGRSDSNTDAKFSAFGTTIARGMNIGLAASSPKGIPEKAGYAILHQILQTMVIAQQQGINLTDQDASNWFVTGIEQMSNDESYDAMFHIMGTAKRPRTDDVQTGSNSAVCGVDWNVINRMTPEEALKETNGAMVRIINAVFTGYEMPGATYQLRQCSDFTQQLIARLNKREVRRDESTGEDKTVQAHPHTASELLEIITAGLAAWHLSALYDGKDAIESATDGTTNWYGVESNPDLAFLKNLDSITELRRKNAAAALGKSYGTSILSHEELIKRIYNSL